MVLHSELSGKLKVSENVMDQVESSKQNVVAGYPCKGMEQVALQCQPKNWQSIFPCHHLLRIRLGRKRKANSWMKKPQLQCNPKPKQ